MVLGLHIIIKKYIFSILLCVCVFGTDTTLGNFEKEEEEVMVYEQRPY